MFDFIYNAFQKTLGNIVKRNKPSAEIVNEIIEIFQNGKLTRKDLKELERLIVSEDNNANLYFKILYDAIIYRNIIKSKEEYFKSLNNFETELKREEIPFYYSERMNSMILNSSNNDLNSININNININDVNINSINDDTINCSNNVLDYINSDIPRSTYKNYPWIIDNSITTSANRNNCKGIDCPKCMAVSMRRQVALQAMFENQYKDIAVRNPRRPRTRRGFTKERFEDATSSEKEEYLWWREANRRRRQRIEKEIINPINNTINANVNPINNTINNTINDNINNTINNTINTMSTINIQENNTQISNELTFDQIIGNRKSSFNEQPGSNKSQLIMKTSNILENPFTKKSVEILSKREIETPFKKAENDILSDLKKNVFENDTLADIDTLKNNQKDSLDVNVKDAFINEKVNVKDVVMNDKIKDAFMNDSENLLQTGIKISNDSEHKNFDSENQKTGIKIQIDSENKNIDSENNKIEIKTETQNSAQNPFSEILKRQNAIQNISSDKILEPVENPFSKDNSVSTNHFVDSAGKNKPLNDFISVNPFSSNNLKSMNDLTSPKNPFNSNFSSMNDLTSMNTPLNMNNQQTINDQLSNIPANDLRVDSAVSNFSLENPFQKSSKNFEGNLLKRKLNWGDENSNKMMEGNNSTNPFMNDSSNPFTNNSTNPFTNNSSNLITNNSSNPFTNNSDNLFLNNSSNPFLNSPFNEEPLERKRARRKRE